MFVSNTDQSFILKIETKVSHFLKVYKLPHHNIIIIEKAQNDSLYFCLSF